MRIDILRVVMDSVDQGDAGCGRSIHMGIRHTPDSQMDRVSGVFQCLDVSHSNLFPGYSADVHYGVFSCTGRNSLSITLRDRSFGSIAIMMKIQTSNTTFFGFSCKPILRHSGMEHSCRL